MVDKAPAGSRYLKKLLLHSCIFAPTNPQHIQQFEAEFGVRVLQQTLESMNWQESLMLVEISVPDCSAAQPRPATMTPCARKLSWSSAASIVHAFQPCCSFIHVDLDGVHLFRVCACLHKPFPCCFTTRCHQKQNKRMEVFWENVPCTVRFQLLALT